MSKGLKITKEQKHYWMLWKDKQKKGVGNKMINLNNIAALCAENAKKRGKVGYDVSHLLSWWSIRNELSEFDRASETEPSEHIPEYTEAQEELADILLACLTELHRRNVDVEAIITKKLEFNQQRK